MPYKVENAKLSNWVREVAGLCQPDVIYWCDGSKAEYDRLMAQMVASGMATPLAKRPNCFLFRSDPSDVARVEARTYVSTPSPEDAGPTNNWIAPDELKQTMTALYTGCMRGRTMYVIPFSMGPIGSPMAKIGVEITPNVMPYNQLWDLNQSPFDPKTGDPLYLDFDIIMWDWVPMQDPDFILSVLQCDQYGI